MARITSQSISDVGQSVLGSWRKSLIPKFYRAAIDPAAVFRNQSKPLPTKATSPDFVALASRIGGMASTQKHRSLVFPLTVLLVLSTVIGTGLVGDNSDDVNRTWAMLLALFGAWFVWIVWRWSAEPSDCS